MWVPAFTLTAPIEIDQHIQQFFDIWYPVKHCCWKVCHEQEHAPCEIKAEYLVMFENFWEIRESNIKLSQEVSPKPASSAWSTLQIIQRKIYFLRAIGCFYSLAFQRNMHNSREIILVMQSLVHNRLQTDFLQDLVLSLTFLLLFCLLLCSTV